jgi:hypothetical protein
MASSVLSSEDRSGHMKYMNATQAAIEIGISYRTMRRWIDADRIAVERGEDGQYSIAVSEVERLKQEQAERPIPARRRQNETALEQRLVDLELRVRTLEDMASRDKIPIESSVLLPSYNLPTQKIQPQKSPTIANRAMPDEIPEGSLLMAEFAAQHGVNRATMWRHCTSGIQGDRIETIERPKPGGRTGDVERWLSPELQEEARAFWRRHSVRFTL